MGNGLKKKQNGINIPIFCIKNSQKNCKRQYHPVETGELFANKYFILQKIGSGGSSTVWKSLNLYSKQKLALKIVKSTYEDLLAAKEEIKTLEYIRTKSTEFNCSDKFVQLVDYFQIRDVNCIHACIVLELMPYDLLSYLRMSGEKGLPLNVVKKIMLQVLQGLEILHHKFKLIHTDIKPANILISSDLSTVKISDLGSVCSVRNPNIKGLQTHKYRSHEFLLQAPFGKSADIWSVGCMAFELATGKSLFASRDGKDYSRNEDHLALTIATLGEIPKHVALSGKRSLIYFTKEGKLKHITKRKPQSLYEILKLNCKWKAYEAREFSDFILPTLHFDPKKRAKTRDCIRHLSQISNTQLINNFS